jgi:hypothetical protein
MVADYFQIEDDELFKKVMATYNGEINSVIVYFNNNETYFITRNEKIVEYLINPENSVLYIKHLTNNESVRVYSDYAGLFKNHIGAIEVFSEYTF